MEQVMCSTLAMNEPLIGTASQNAFHFVMSHPKREWLPVIEEMPGAAGDFACLIKPLKNQAMISLKNGDPDEQGTIWLFPHGYRFDGIAPQDYAALIDQGLNGNIKFPYRELPKNQQVILNCTHGKRDSCCAKYGRMMFEALSSQAPPHIWVWEVSHLGGHRFAATLVVQPQGYWYGQLRPEDAPALLESIENRTVLLPKYRGKASYPPPLQVAEAWAWEQLQQRGEKGKINLVNPYVAPPEARVKVNMLIDGHDHGTVLTLHGENYVFVADCSGATKDRIIWTVTQAEEVKLGYEPTP